MFWNKVEKRNIVEEINNFSWTTIKNTNDDIGALHESTYFKCVKKIGDSVGKVPCYVMQSLENGDIKAKIHYLYNILSVRPNPYMSAIDFFKTMEYRRQHEGESFALIVRNNMGKITGLYPIKVLELLVDDIGIAKTSKENAILVKYTCGNNGNIYNCLYRDVLHFKNFTLDGLRCNSNIDYIRRSVNISKQGQKYQEELFANGLTSKAVVQLISDIKDEKELKKIQEKFTRLFSEGKRVFTVPAGFNITPLNLSLADSQFAELKKLQAIDICTAMGVPPYMVGILDGYNNNSLEQSSLSFLVDTLQILFQSIEQEINYKLFNESERKKGFYAEFNVGVLLRTSAEVQADVITKYVQNGVYTINDARRILNMTKITGGDDPILASGSFKLKNLDDIATSKVVESLKGGDDD